MSRPAQPGSPSLTVRTLGSSTTNTIRRGVPNADLRGEYARMTTWTIRSSTAILAMWTRLAGGIVLLLVLAPLAIAAQPIVVEGRVQDANGTPVPYANVRIEGTTDGAATNVSGRFRFRTRRHGSATLRASAVGYEATERSVRLAPGDTVRVQITLSSTRVRLDETVVTGTYSTGPGGTDDARPDGGGDNAGGGGRSLPRTAVVSGRGGAGRRGRPVRAGRRRERDQNAARWRPPASSVPLRVARERHFRRRASLPRRRHAVLNGRLLRPVRRRPLRRARDDVEETAPSGRAGTSISASPPPPSPLPASCSPRSASSPSGSSSGPSCPRPAPPRRWATRSSS